ncbi:response regulator [Staphylococcus aureus]
MRQGLRFLLSTIENIEATRLCRWRNIFRIFKRHEHPDIVLLDLVMPGMNGIEITEYIEAHYPDIKVLVLTSYVNVMNM